MTNRPRRGPPPESYRNLKIHCLLRKRAHIIIETKPIFALLFSREDKIPLALFGRFHDDLAIRGDHAVIEVKGPAGLDLTGNLSIEINLLACSLSTDIWSGATPAGRVS